MDFQNFQKFNEDRIFDGDKYLKFQSFINVPSLGSLDVPQKIWARSVQPF